MAEAKSDSNQVKTILGVSNVDGSTTILIKANTSSNSILAEDAQTGSDLSGDESPRDNNGIVALLAVSSSDGVTPVVVYADASGNILIDSN